MNSPVDRTSTSIWCRRLAEAGFPVQTTANVDRRVTAIIEWSMGYLAYEQSS